MSRWVCIDGCEWLLFRRQAVTVDIVGEFTVREKTFGPSCLMFRGKKHTSRCLALLFGFALLKVEVFKVNAMLLRQACPKTSAVKESFNQQ